MDRVTLYHNPQCSHSRGALGLLQTRGIGFDLIEYLKTPPSRADLEAIIAVLDDPVADFVRKDKRFAELKLNPDDYTSKDAVIEVLLKYPELMQRPIVIKGARALIARPAEKLNALF
ncbi:MAG: ArsC/Spx/MgsR family protein [Candidatus Binataceae bacterium]|jgi:arsenate reductase